MPRKRAQNKKQSKAVKKKELTIIIFRLILPMITIKITLSKNKIKHLSPQSLLLQKPIRLFRIKISLLKSTINTITSFNNS